MNLVICTNHSYPHVGGSEKVVQEISESMVNDFGCDCSIISLTVQKEFVYNKVKYYTCPRNFNTFFKQLEILKIDHVFVYSDCFYHWQNMMAKSEKISCTKSIALVGMNNMPPGSYLNKIFLNKIKQFKIITHSNTGKDYNWCKNNNVDVSVIPNSVNFQEFNGQKNNSKFKNKYGINTKYLILCVANFFPGKGQEFLPLVFRNVYESIKDFTLVAICSTIKYPLAKYLQENFERSLQVEKFQYRMLVDIPREDVINAFYDADVFVFPSQQEVAPLVILEAMASRTAWVAQPVGTIPFLRGGVTTQKGEIDKRGNMLLSKNILEEFSQNLKNVLTDQSLKTFLGEDGYNDVNKNYNWQIIKKMYCDFFIRKDKYE